MEQGSVVYKVDDLDREYPGKIRQVGGTDHLPAPDYGMALVSWSRTSLTWEYIEDLRE